MPRSVNPVLTFSTLTAKEMRMATSWWTTLFPLVQPHPARRSRAPVPALAMLAERSHPIAKIIAFTSPDNIRRIAWVKTGFHPLSLPTNHYRRAPETLLTQANPRIRALDTQLSSQRTTISITPYECSNALSSSQLSPVTRIVHRRNDLRVLDYRGVPHALHPLPFAKCPSSGLFHRNMPHSYMHKPSTSLDLPFIFLTGCSTHTAGRSHRASCPESPGSKEKALSYAERWLWSASARHSLTCHTGLIDTAFELAFHDRECTVQQENNIYFHPSANRKETAVLQIP
ncbi:hypothetical protein NMY22_g3060 [Coprinellus aureogranulatus]|nr:hypothetical protein NMY22_g3060 [Coprinellus aureogranulatus]